MLFLAACLGLVSLLAGRALTHKQRQLVQEQEAWPVFVDSLSSLISAGLTLGQAFEDAIVRAPAAIERHLKPFQHELKTKRVVDSLPALARGFESGVAGEFVALLSLAHKFGGNGLAPALKAHAQRVRAVNALRAQLRVRTNATIALAKLGVTAPWIILALLNFRPETAVAFSTPTGLSVLLAGLAACVVAYRLITLLSRLPERPIVYG